MQADLAAWKKALDEDAVGTHDAVQWTATWRGDPYLSGLFEPSELERPLPDKRKDCAILSNEIGRLLAHAVGLTPNRTDQ